MSRRKQARPNKVKDDEEQQELTKGIDNSAIGTKEVFGDECSTTTTGSGHTIKNIIVDKKSKIHHHQTHQHQQQQHHIKNHHLNNNNVKSKQKGTAVIVEDEDSRNNNNNHGQDGRVRDESKDEHRKHDNASSIDKELEEKESLTASIHALLGNIMMQQQWPTSNGAATGSLPFQSAQYSINPTIEFAASALESNPSVQDLAVLQQTLLTLQQQQLLQLQLIQQLQHQLNPQSDGGGGSEDDDDDGCSSTNSATAAAAPRLRHRVHHQRRSRSPTGTEPTQQEEDDGGVGEDEDDDEDAVCLQPKLQKSDQKSHSSPSSHNVKCSNSNGDGLSPHFATLLNCHNHQDPNQPLSPGLQGGNCGSDGIGGLGSCMDGGMGGFSGLGGLNSLEMLQKRAEEVLDSASQGLLQSSLGADDLRKKSGDKNSREPFFKHRCRYCGKVFGSDSALQIHIRSHTGERPFKCNVCGSRFTTKGNLKVHFQRHTSKFPHVKMNPHPVPEHLDRFHPPLIASGETSPEPPSPPPQSSAASSLPLHLAGGGPQQQSHLPLPNPFNNFTTNPHHHHYHNQMWRLVGVAERIQQQQQQTPSSVLPTSGSSGIPMTNSLASGVVMPQDLSKKQQGGGVERGRRGRQGDDKWKSDDADEDDDDDMMLGGGGGGEDEDEDEDEQSKDLKVSLIKKVTDEINRRRISINSNSSSSPSQSTARTRSRSCSDLIKKEVVDGEDDDEDEDELAAQQQKDQDLANNSAIENDSVVHDEDTVKDEKFDLKGPARSRSSQNQSSGRRRSRRRTRRRSSAKSRSRSRSGSISTNQDNDDDDDDEDSCFDQPENLSSKSLPLMYPLPLKLRPERPSSLTSTEPALPKLLPSSADIMYSHSLPIIMNHVSGGSDPARDPAIYTNLLPRPGSNDNAWESLIEVTRTSETTKLQQLVDNIEHKLTDPNQCIICHRVLSCKSALQMHYRTHTGERPFKCKICGRAFTTKGNLKTHMGVHRAKPPLRVLHQCPVCHKRFTNSLVLQQHIRLHTGEPTDLTLDQIRAAEVREPFSPSITTFHPPNFHPPPHLFLPGGVLSSSSAGTTKSPPQLSTDSTASSFSTSLAALENQVRTITTTFANSTNVVPSEDELSSLVNLRRQRMMMRMMSSANGHGSPMDEHGMLMNSDDELDDDEEEEDLGGEDDGGGSSPMSGISSSDWVFEHPRPIMIPSPIPMTPLDLTSGGASTSAGGTKDEPTTLNAGSGSNSAPGSASAILPPSGSVIHPPSSSLNPPGPTFLSFIHAGHHPFNLVHPRAPPDYTSMWNAAVGARGNTTCNICLKTFACNSALEIHYRSHTKERPFKCNVCDRGFSTKGNMKQHSLTHKLRDNPDTVDSDGDGDDGTSTSAMSCSGGCGGLKRSSSESSIPPQSNASAKTPGSDESRLLAESEAPEERTSVSPSSPIALAPSSPKTTSSSITSPGLPQERVKMPTTESDSSCASSPCSTSPNDNHLVLHQQPHHLYQNNAPKQNPSQNTISPSSSFNHNNAPAPPITSTTNNSNNNSSSNNSSTNQHPHPPQHHQQHHHHHHSTHNSSSSSSQQESKHICEVCHKSFSSSSSVHIHMRTHTGDKPFKCSVCSKAFTTKGNLKVHMGTHMWTNGLSRRGRRMSLELTLPFPTPPHHPSALGTIKDHHHHHHRPDLFFPYQTAHPLILKNGHQPSPQHPKVMELVLPTTKPQPKQPEQEAIV